MLGGGGRGGRGGGGFAGGGGGTANRVQKTLLVDLDKPADPPRELWTTNSQDRYADPGTPLQKTLPNGERGIMLDGDNIYLTGKGLRPPATSVPHRFNLTTLKTEQLFKCDDDHYEVVEGLLDDHAAQVLHAAREPHRAAQLLCAHRRRDIDGLHQIPRSAAASCGRWPRSWSLTNGRTAWRCRSRCTCLPATRKARGCPTVMWAYPREYDDARTADAVAVTGSQERFTEMSGYSEIFFALDGFAVLDNASMPIVGTARHGQQHSSSNRW